MDEEPKKPGRGRPRSADPRALQLVAMRLIDEQGYHETTLADVARQAGVSIRTVHRYFGTKRELVWREGEQRFEHVAELLRAADQARPAMDIIAETLVELLRLSAEDEVEQLRLRLLVTVPELGAQYGEGLDRWSAVFAEYVAERSGGQPHDLLPALAGQVARMATRAAMVWWVGNPGSDLAEGLGTVLAALNDGMRQAVEQGGASSGSPAAAPTRAAIADDGTAAG